MKKFISLSTGFILFLGFFSLVSSGNEDQNPYTIDLVKKIKDYNPNLVTTVYSRDGQILGKLFREKRFLIELKDMPQYLIKAFLAAEDSAFYEHEGVDPAAIFRAFFKNVEAGDIVQGGSTITQQVVKQLVLGSEKSYARKLKEAILAYRLEKILGKDEILSIYLNEIYFGAGAYGVEAAALTYFSKHTKELNLVESALLAGLPRAPVAYNPFLDKEAAKLRQQYVLNRMLKLGWIDQETHDDAQSQTLEFKRTPDPSWTVGAYYLEEVRRWLVDYLTPENLSKVGIELENNNGDAVYTSGLQVKTALDITHQLAAEKAIREFLDESSPGFSFQQQRLQAALVSIEAGSGDVVALVGGYDFKESQFNRATQARRQPGSAFKPFVFSAALDSGYTAASVINDEPKIFLDPQTGKAWEPKNFGEKYYGPTLLRTALVRSQNLFTVQLAESIGINKVIKRARQMGFNCDFPPYLSVSLGSVDVSLINLCQAYTAFARGGSYVKPRLVLSIKDNQGREIYQAKTEAVDAISPQNAFIITSFLKDVIQRGTATVCRQLNRPAAGKTGTTNDEKEAWFIGYTPYLLTGVYVGFDDRTPMGPTGTGGRIAAPLWLKYRLAVEDMYETEDFPQPPDIIFKNVNEPGSVETDLQPAKSHLLPFIKGTEP
ncbi:MAG: hypothetical protein A2161_10495 [Candidatus Schekmanbacteria bacterium RBG_13_48_7]|uniref:peptidoglycan glycosyltransferase n=1 Tax=Candidatus Schekmanbacteria bacterium RBG_13_48_7 TaxID=1817878 RepID=A0A1F7RJ98_9BACT|nr:MAG: hypothetical protein A2161_10495 [Candidatus Schekmanbacteria bacterium RBG_13_48_7]